ncbi:MAG: efflux RND transporter permease subunit [Parvularculaceae bacterium]
MKLGVSGTLARAFINSPLTPLILLASLAMGLLALASIPREEEPQISVPLIDVHIRAEGLRAPDAVELVTKPLEIILKGVDDVEHVYSQTVDNGAVVTARFKVGIDADDAILRVHEKIRANISDIPVDIPEPVVVGRGINDVPVVTLTLSPSPQASDHWNDNQLYKIAERLREELVKTEDVGLSFIVGGRADQIRIEPDPERLALYGVTLQQLAGKVRGANRSFESGSIRLDGGSVVVEVGQTLEGPVDIGLLLLTTRDGRPVYINDVARVVYDVAQSEHRVWTLRRDHAFEPLPAVTLAFGKRKGANAVLVAESLLERLETLDGSLIPDGVDVAITRNYGETASEKSNELLFHLALATGSIVLLIIFVIGWREGLVTLVIIPTTILLTLFASNLLGYTINRVSLFALIFSIGILVDDAIVVIENIARHWAMGDDRTRASAAVDAVAEVGNPTIVATATVVVALLPMLFVSGLMGPYMAPIPINASAAMIFSFFVAVVVTPWLMMRFASRAPTHHGDTEGALGRFYRRAARPIIASRKVARRFLIGVALATVVAVSFFGFKFVTVKLLPFDNKSEFQVVVDLPEGSSLEETERVLLDAATRLEGIEEITSVQIYAGTAAPFNFNGLVRHYYLRASQELGDIQVNLEAKHHRKRSSHAIALEARELLHGVATPNDTSIKIVEVPPGPPVLSTLLAEVYGPDAQSRRKAAEIVRELYRKVAFIVDDDVAMGGRPPRVRISIDQDSLEFYQVDQNDVYETLDALLHGARVGYSHRGEGRDPVEIVVSLPKEDLVWTERLLSTPVPANTIPGARGVVELGDVVRVSKEQGSHVIFRRDGRFAEMVMGELAGAWADCLSCRVQMK